MTITISEDNGFLFGGVPSLVVVTVTFDNGKQMRFPYTAEKAISALYEDLSRLNTDAVPDKPLAEIVTLAPFMAVPEPKKEPLAVNKSSEIEKGDIVECIHLENRNDHAGSKATEDIVVGGKYRVTKVLPGGYECLDDTAPLQFKLFLMRHEVKLFAKGKAQEKKKVFLEEGIHCHKCSEIVYCGLHDGFYVGKCECGESIRKSRQEVKGGQAGNPVLAAS